MSLGLKALLIPWMLHRLIPRLALDCQVETVRYPAVVVLFGAGLVLFCYWVVLPIERLGLAASRNIIALTLAVVLLGLLMMVVRRQVVSQVIGFMSIFVRLPHSWPASVGKTFLPSCSNRGSPTCSLSRRICFDTVGWATCIMADP